MSEAQLHQSSGLRNFEFSISGAQAAASQDWLSTVTALTPAGTKPTMTRTNQVQPRTVTATLIADATVATRTLIIKVYGRNQFGEYQTEILPTLTATAGQTKCVQSAKVYDFVDAWEIITATNDQAGDKKSLGACVNLDAVTPATVIWGCPVRVGRSSDFRSIRMNEAGTLSWITLADITFVPDQHGLKLAATSAPDSGNDRVTTIKGRTTWGV